MTMADKPLDLQTMTPDELFHLLGLDDMNDGERLGFLAHMNAWSKTVIPGPNHWWIHAVITAHGWRLVHQQHVDNLIADALGTEQP